MSEHIEVVELRPFTKKDAEEMKQSEQKFCSTCAFIEDCTTIDDQNIKSQFRDGISDISEVWGCTIHKTEDEYLNCTEDETV